MNRRDFLTFRDNAERDKPFAAFTVTNEYRVEPITAIMQGNYIFRIVKDEDGEEESRQIDSYSVFLTEKDANAQALEDVVSQINVVKRDLTFLIGRKTELENGE